MKGVQCYELFGGIALKNHAFSLHFILSFIYKQQNWKIKFSEPSRKYLYLFCNISYKKTYIIKFCHRLSFNVSQTTNGKPEIYYREEAKHKI